MHQDPHDEREGRCGPRERGRRPRKERVLHTRISEDLAEDIRRVAEELRVPVSNIVRNVLEEAFSVVESVTDNMGEWIEDVVDEAEAARDRIRSRHARRRRGARRHARAAQGDELRDDDSRGSRSRSGPEAAEGVEAGSAAEVLGWQPLVLSRGQRCSDCGAVLERGERAYAAVTPAGTGAEFLCESCLERRH